MNVKVDTISIAHEDARRRLIAVFNGTFVAKQIKIIEVKEDSILGNHYHPYEELFYILKGEAHFTLVDIKTGEKKEITLVPSNRMVIGKEIAHKVRMLKDTITIEATEMSYKSPEENDRKFIIHD